jgi:precorrin-2/cobalt-factor-2 C20-methyltransferase
MAGGEAMSGIFYGLGVGPGDPELITVKAWRIISTAPVLAYLAANGSESTARDIAKPFIPEDVIEIAIDVPMKTEREPAQAAYDKGAAAIRAHLDEGRDVAMLCEGDPFFYGSFMYVYSRLAGEFETVVVPGVSSITACAARIGRPLAARNEVLKVLPATLEADRLREELKQAEAAAIIKVGRHFAKVRDVLAQLDLTSRAVAVEKATRDAERITRVADIEGDALPYFTTILVYAGSEKW